MPIVHKCKTTVSTENVCDVISHYDAVEIRDEKTHKIHDDESQNITFTTENISDAVCELLNQEVMEKDNPRTINAQMEQEQAVEAIMKELTSEEQVKSEPDIQIIDRGGEDNGITIVDIDDVIQSRVNLQDTSHMFIKEQEDATVTELIDNRLKIPGYKVVRVQPIATNDELFGNSYPAVAIDIKPQILSNQRLSRTTDILPTVYRKPSTNKKHTSNVTSIFHSRPSNTEESKMQDMKSETNTVEQKLTKIVPQKKSDELEVYIPPIPGTSKSVSAMMYKMRKRKEDQNVVTVHKAIDRSKIGPPVPTKDQLANFYYCDKCPKSFKDMYYFR